jgi:polyisoprenoid-binding protein YceI
MRRSAAFAALALAATSPFALALDRGNSPPVPAGAYTLDKAHTSLIFRVSHMGFSTYTGRFTSVDAKLDFDPARLASSRVNVTIDPRSIDADNAPSGFLEMLSGKDWLDVAKFPKWRFARRPSRSQALTPSVFAASSRCMGSPSLSCSTRVAKRRLRRPSHGSQCAHRLLGAGKFQRSDFGVSLGIPAPGTNMGVGDEVEVVLESEFNGPPLAK